MVLHSFLFAGKVSRNYGLYISGGSTFNAPERDTTVMSVPGRNGDLVIDNGRWKNITVSYSAFVVKKFKQNAESIRNWLSGTTGNQRIEDDYHPEYFRIGRFSGNIEWDITALNRAGQTTLTFDCKPQRFLKLGETPIKIESATTLTNNWQTSLPLITIWGEGAAGITINGETVQISNIPTNIVLDCDLQNAYSVSGLQNLNNLITLPPSGNFLSLIHGDNEISFSGGVTRVEIIPRWWTL